MAKNKPETCVICGATTEYFTDDPVAQRKCYVAGCGQLCEKCYCRNEYQKNQNIELTPNELEILFGSIDEQRGRL